MNQKTYDIVDDKEWLFEQYKKHVDNMDLLKRVLEGAVKAHTLSGNNERLTEVQWVLNQIKIIEDGEIN